MIYADNPYTKLLHKHPYQECKCCVMDTSDPWISFDERGVCNHCLAYARYLETVGTPKDRERKLEAMISGIKARGKGKDYDCILGLSGGVDSSYLAWFAVEKLGLRPLVVHVDAGWNSELAVNNIQNIVQRLKLDMHTLVIDWPEIRDLQKAYFLAGIANLDVPQDHAFIASLYKEALKYGIKDILSGGNMQTESILPDAWGYDASDSVSLKAIHRKYGTVKLKNYPTVSTLEKYVYYPFVQKMRVHRPLELIDYKKESAKDTLKQSMGWRDYGGKHYESLFTKFFQAHYLPTKFGYDKRRAHFASLIVSGQMTKDEARRELEKPLYDPRELVDDKAFWIKKLGLSEVEFERVMAAPPSFYTDFANNEKSLGHLKMAARVAKRLFGKLRLQPPIR
ncbi:MAG: N-acetyl sugar amidotransferase [Rhizobiaceae bacterium]|nr:N-acetyl sugar amidotransferase [Rhizobiaceae bacterium]MCZ8352529.1 N-acetyl sugar amidotransferase [Rhizobium sp.]